MFKTGLICKKTFGEDSGKICIILEKEKGKPFAIVDGEVKRKRCNISHLEPIGFTEIMKDSPHEEVLKVLEASGFKVKNFVKKSFIKKLRQRSKKKNED